MNLITIFQRFPDQEACIEHLERIRWGDNPGCPHCGSVVVGRKADGDRVGRWNCHACHSSFNVLSGTIFQKTKIPLQKWFLGIGLMVNAKKSLSSYQLTRDLDLNPRSALYMQQRIRAQMATEQEGLFLEGIIEADETYVGGKPRRTNVRDEATPAPRGRGTNKTPVIGAVERGGKVTAQVATDLSGRGVMTFIRENVNPLASMLITDEYRAYRAVRRFMPHAVINHSVRYADGDTHTNTIEGFWGLLKRAWYGVHHRYSTDYMPLYVAEACWKYNHRSVSDGFGGGTAGRSALQYTDRHRAADSRSACTPRPTAVKPVTAHPVRRSSTTPRLRSRPPGRTRPRRLRRGRARRLRQTRAP